MSLNEFGNFIAQVGFPIAVAVWLLYITESMDRRNVATINRLTQQIVVLNMLLSVITKIKVPDVVDGERDKT